MKETKEMKDKNIKFGDGVLDEVKTKTNSRLGNLAKIAIDLLFDYLDKEVKDLPETIRNLRNTPETEQQLADLLSQKLSEEGLIPQGYNGLSNELLIYNLHQEGYNDGMFAGHILTMNTLTDYDISN